MPYDETTKQYEVVHSNEFLFNHLIERYALEQQPSNYLGAEYQVFEPGNPIHELRFVSVEADENSDEPPTQYIDIDLLRGERTITPYRIARVIEINEEGEPESQLALYLGERRYDNDPAAIYDFLRDLAELEQNDALRPVDPSDDELLGTNMPPYSYV